MMKLERILKVLLYLLGISICLPQVLAKVPEEELQEVRFAKAELAMLDGNEKEALRIIKKNLNLKHLHLPSYHFLADYHFKKSNYAKGMRVYHYLIKKLHSEKVLTSPKVDDIGDIISDLPAPSREVLEIYFKTGMQYFKMSENPKFDKEFRKKLLLFSQKYFGVCEYYQFNLPQTKYMLGIIKNRREDFLVSIEYLVEARDLLEDLPETDKETLHNLDYLLGDNLVRAGFSDSGSLYLKSVYLSKDADSSLKNFASTYLNALNTSFLSVSFRYSQGYTNNIEELTKSEQELRERFVSVFPYTKDAYYSSWGVNAFYNSSKFGHWSYLLYFDAENKNMREKELSTNDERTITGSAEAKYDNFNKSTLKLSTTYAYSMYRPESTLSLTKLSNYYSFILSYLYTLKRGIITYRIPYSLTNSISEDNLHSYGTGMSYSPFIKNKYWGLSYSLDYSRSEESSTSPISDNYSFGATNSTSFNDQNTLFTSLSYTSNDNSRDSLAYSRYAINMTHYLLLLKIRGLSFNVTLSYESTDYKSKDEMINVWQTSLGMSYNF